MARDRSDTYSNNVSSTISSIVQHASTTDTDNPPSTRSTDSDGKQIEWTQEKINALPYCRLPPLPPPAHAKERENPSNSGMSVETCIISIITVGVFIMIASFCRDQSKKTTGYTQDLYSCLSSAIVGVCGVALFALVFYFVMPAPATNAMKTVRKSIWG